MRIDKRDHGNPTTVSPDLPALGWKLIVSGESSVGLACFGVFLFREPLIRLGQYGIPTRWLARTRGRAVIPDLRL